MIHSRWPSTLWPEVGGVWKGDSRFYHTWEWPQYLSCAECGGGMAVSITTMQHVELNVLCASCVWAHRQVTAPSVPTDIPVGDILDWIFDSFADPANRKIPRINFYDYEDTE